MNAVISLCHFCDNHGPSVLFSTQSFHANDENDSNLKFYGSPEKLDELLDAKSRNDEKADCEACQTTSGYITNDHENKISFISSERPLEENVAKLVDQAAFRSLSCEVVPGKEGEVYFGDERRGHVLSHTFFLQDSRARGFQRWFSIIIFMRDKHFLINSWLFFQKHLTQLVNQLQAKAAEVYGDEQKVCPQRAARLNDGTITGSSVARPITVLTNSPQLFAQIHLWFTWLLSVGAKRLEEYTPSKLLDCQLKQYTEEGFVVVEKVKDSGNGCTKIVHDSSTVYHLRELLQHMGSQKFTHLIFALLTGKQLVTRGPQRLVQFLFHLLKFFLPSAKFRCVEYADEFLGLEDFNVVGLSLSSAVPVASSSVERLDIVSLLNPGEGDSGLELDRFQYMGKSGEAVPTRLPTLLNDIISFLSDDQLSNQLAYTLLSHHIQVWQNTTDVVKTGKSMAPGQDHTALLQSLGAQEQDTCLLNFWAT